MTDLTPADLSRWAAKAVMGLAVCEQHGAIMELDLVWARPNHTCWRPLPDYASRIDLVFCDLVPAAREQLGLHLFIDVRSRMAWWGRAEQYSIVASALWQGDAPEAIAAAILTALKSAWEATG